MNSAWAIEIVEDNYCAILSEAGRSFDRDFLLKWVDEYKEGFFLMDSSSPLDCTLLDPEKFLRLYQFERGDVDTMFRLVTQRY